jgi:hypothetical protein
VNIIYYILRVMLTVALVNLLAVMPYFYWNGDKENMLAAFSVGLGFFGLFVALGVPLLIFRGLMKSD